MLLTYTYLAKFHYLWQSWRSRWHLPKIWFRFIAFSLSCLLLLLTGTGTPTPGLGTTEILWDTYGVPHIFANNNEQLFHAFGWAQAQSHGNLILKLYGQSRGRAAEYWGEDEVESDRWVHTTGIPARAQNWYEAQSPTFRTYLDAFAAGVNAYIDAYPEQIDDEMEAVVPITGVDLLAHVQRVLHFTFIVNPGQIDSLLEHAQTPSTSLLTQVIQARSDLGSNGWAIAPSRSASGNAMLLANPHLPWSDLFLWYEAQLTAPGFDAYGASLIGIPVLTIAFNDYLGWTHTVNTHDGWDAYELTVTERGYQFDGAVRAFEQAEQVLKIRQPDGSIREEPLLVRRSVHGPVVAEDNDTALALRVVGLDQSGALEQWWDMARATNLAEFEAALQRLQIPMFTILYADREGHILHLFNGQVPVRQEGDFEYWLGIIPGESSTTLWTESHPYSELPRASDPPSGWLQNANDPPWTTTFPSVLNPDNYPPYMAPRGPMWFRAQHSVKMLESDEQISLEEMVKYKHSTHVELAERLLDDLIPAARQQGGELGRKAAEVLDKWDRQTDSDSRGAVLFSFWEQALDYSNGFATPWNEKKPLTTPDGLANPTSAVAALEAAATEVEATYGTLDIPWGEVFRLRSGEVELPANGGDLGIFRNLSFVPSEDGRFQVIGGDSYVAVIEFSNPVRAMVLTSYGNATQPGKQDSSEQLKMFANQELRPVWRSRSEIEAHLAARETI
ncbi:MAG: acylase [Cyanobacteria bacterium P01_A01_bin.37]